MTGVRKQPIFLGVDGGGSKCHAVVATASDRILGSGTAGPANAFYNYEQATRSIVEATRLALSDAGLPQQKLGELTAGIGLAGVNLPGIFDKVQAWAHPFASLTLGTDLEIACLGAHAGGDGAVVIAGTGSSAFARVNGRKTIIGASGFPLGDVGGGAWLGLQALQYVFLAKDDLVPPSLLTDFVQDTLGECGNTIVENMAAAATWEYARLAPLVFEAADRQDVAATRILKTGAEHLSTLIRRICESSPPRVSMIGGLAERIRPWLNANVVELLSPAIESPAAGGLYLAQQGHEFRHQQALENV